MRIRRDFTFIAYSRIRRHRNERVLSATWSPPFAFLLSVWEWSWSFGFGFDDGPSWYGLWLSYTKPGRSYDGYWQAGLSHKLTWEQSE